MTLYKLPKQYGVDFSLPHVKPLFPVKIDLSNPISKGLVLVDLADSSTALTGNTITYNGLADRGVSLRGKQQEKVGTAGSSFITTDGFTGDMGDVTVMLVVRREIDIVGSRLASVFRNGTGGAQEYNLGNGFGSPSDDQKPRMNGGNNPEMWIDGIQQSNVNPSETALVSGRYYTMILSAEYGSVQWIDHNRLGGNNNDQTPLSIPLWYQWNRILTDAEKASISRDPNQVLMPESASLYFTPSTGGGGISITSLLNSNYMVEYSMKKNTAGQSIGAQMVTISDGSDFTGTVTAEVTIDNGTKTAGGGSVTHEGEGYHSYAPTQAETNGDHIAVSFAGTGALSQTIQVYTTFPQSVDNDTKISLIPTTAMRGTDSANTTTPPTTAQIWAEATRELTSAAKITSDASAITMTSPGIISNVTLVDTTTTNTDMVAEAPTTAQIWAETTRILTSGANIVLAKGVGVTGFNDIAATDVVTGGAITTSSGNASVDVVKINGTVVIGAGNAGDLWRA